MNNSPSNSDATSVSEGLSTFDIVQKSLAKRRAAERRFKFYGMASIVLGLMFLLILFADIFGKGYSAFVQTQIKLEIHFDPAMVDPDGSRSVETLSKADYNGLLKKHS